MSSNTDDTDINTEVVSEDSLDSSTDSYDSSVIDPPSEEGKSIVSLESFRINYDKVIKELDALHSGVFDETEAESVAGLCLLVQIGLIKSLAASEAKARALKKDVEFAKADAFYRLSEPDDKGKRLAATAVTSLIPRESSVVSKYNELNQAEKEAKEISTLFGVIKEAHVTFRMLIKKGV